MRVLVVEDDRALGSFLQKGLALEGHEVEWVGDGDAAVCAVLAAPPELVVLDLSLPGRDGTAVLEAVRDRLGSMAVLVLTGRSQVEERIRCLDLGADDYLQKPFSFHELVARCRAIVRRRERTGKATLSYAGVEINLMEHSVRYMGVPVELTAREFTLLEFLLRRRAECSTRSDLLREVWRTSPEAGPNVVDVYINYLRRKLGAAQRAGGLFQTPAESIIETVRGAGYRLRPLHLVAPVVREPELRLLAQGA